MPLSKLASISVAAALEVHKVASGEPWVALVDITWPDDTHLRLVRYVDDITFDAQDGAGPQVYTAFNWDFGPLEQKSDGSIPKWAARCSNVNGLLEGLLETNFPGGMGVGGVGGSLAIYTVNLTHTVLEAEIALYFDILSSGSDAQWVTFQLGAPSPFRILHPRHIFTSNRCMWVYKGPQCGYSGGLASCSLRIDGTNGCRAHSNQLRFGAFPGIDSNGIRIVSVR